MKKLATFSSAAVLSVVVAGSVSGTALAWHPEGKIVKSVQNVTTNSAVSDANTAATAVAAKPGDVLQYTITVSNPAKAADKHWNDLAFAKMVDTLPAGVEQVSTPSVRVITADLGTILPGKSVTKTYKVKVTATKDGAIENKACFFGDSIKKDAPRTGCDVAIVKVTVPPVTPPVTPPTPPVTPPVTPEPPVVPETPGEGEDVVEETPEALPSVGTGVLAPIAGVATAIAGYGANLLRLKRRNG